MVPALSALTRLKGLYLEFKSPQSHPNSESRRPPPSTRSVLPALTELQFTGVNEYLEDLVARIDAPLLNIFDIRLFHQLLFDTPQLAQLISRTPRFEKPKEACVVFSDSSADVTLPRILNGRLELGIRCRPSDWQLSSLAQVCGPSFHLALFPLVEHLYYIFERFRPPDWQNDIENTQWLELLQPFTAVKNLYLSKGVAQRIVIDANRYRIRTSPTMCSSGSLTTQPSGPQLTCTL